MPSMSTPTATTKFTIDIDIELHRQLKAHCAVTKTTMREFATESMIARLRMQGQPVSREVVERCLGPVDGTHSSR